MRNFDTPFVAETHSWLVRIDPAVKLLAAMTVAMGVSTLHTLKGALVAWGVSAVFILVSGVSLQKIMKRLLIANFFFLFLWLTLPLGLQGVAFPRSLDTLFSLGSLSFSKTGYALALLITLKGNTILTAILLLTGTSTMNANGRALLRLQVPLKLVTLLLLVYRNIGLFSNEAEKLFQAAKLRGFSPSFSMRNYKVYAWLFGMLFVRAWQRSKRVNDAMILRGFVGVLPLLEVSPAQSAPKEMWWKVLLSLILFLVLLHMWEKSFL